MKLLGLGPLASILASLVCVAADFPAPQEGSWIIRDLRFSIGETLPELRLHYRTLGSPKGEPVLILHGTTQSGAAMLGPSSFAIEWKDAIATAEALRVALVPVFIE
jgi:homoserine acetyltransferase